ncbi:hypothetical protein SmaMPs15_000226 [Stenotrophomonas maltophilia phage vB_SmaM_Ps15]|uniref:Uncharacterized protein n=1 Tax=Stenotrophomonas maltophilia phage vB_SmaM_Ps15 TaxID=3071007 RepID=A0AAE9FLH9_9CAUD|nr:hypothetical protein PQC01_gp252 [Stenotrophomonas maltophilia phage vB_SmaM_Ps15]UMO77377.1 hypothetical protein SmaMPs15_000226 [Stenotrophomonas maltophilia phage vB_SmaM_Ps15]
MSAFQADGSGSIPGSRSNQKVLLFAVVQCNLVMTTSTEVGWVAYRPK